MVSELERIELRREGLRWSGAEGFYRRQAVTKELRWLEIERSAW